MAILADRLLTGVKRRITMPANQALLNDTDILAFADDMISSRVIPLMESTNQDYFVTLKDVPLVAGQSIYSIPYRAVGRALRDIKMSDNNHNLRNISLIALEDAQVYDACTLTVGFYFLGDKIRLVPDVPSNISPDQTLKIWYRLPPSSLVTSSSAARVTGITNDTVMVQNVPDTFMSGASVDFVQGHSGNSIYAMDKEILNVNGFNITFASGEVPSNLAPGDWISIVQTSPVINFVPNELYALIETYTAYRCLQAVSDFDGMGRLEADMKKEEENANKILEPRIDGEPTIIINRWGLVRGNKFSQRRWLYGQ